MGVAEAEDAPITTSMIGRGGGVDIHAESITGHLCVFVVGSEDAGEGETPIYERRSALVRIFPMVGVDICESKAGADPGGFADRFKIVADHFLEEDDHGKILGDGVDELAQVAKGASHADWTALGLEVDVP